MRANTVFFETTEAAEAAGFRACKRCRPTDGSAASRHLAAIEKACALLRKSDGVPSLGELADAAGISRFHFHRVFRAVTGETLFRGTRGLKKPVKNFLMDTRAIAGVGNIYACEALYRAGINPRRSVGRLGGPGWERLMVSLRAVLSEAITAGGTTLRDFLNAEGEVGYFAVSLRVYDRKGKPCGRCGTPIRRIVQAGRSTFYCPRCQR